MAIQHQIDALKFRLSLIISLMDKCTIKIEAHRMISQILAEHQYPGSTIVKVRDRSQTLETGSDMWA